MEGKAVAYEPLASNYDWQQIQNELREVAQDISLYHTCFEERGMGAYRV